MTVERILDYMAWSLLITSIIVLRFLERLVENLVEGKAFIIYYGIIGFVTGLFVLYLFYRFKPTYFKSNQEKRASAILSYVFSLSVLFLFGFAYYNKHTGESDLKKQEAIVVDKNKNYRYHTRYLLLKIDNNSARKFMVNQNVWEDTGINDTIQISVGRGALGYEYIYKFTH